MLLVQALLSSSIMFSNFMSIYQRRAEAKEKAEQSNRYCSALYSLQKFIHQVTLCNHATVSGTKSHLPPPS